MININITQTTIEFYSTIADCEINAQLIEPKWEIVDTESLHVISSLGVYCLSTISTTFNGEQFENSDSAINYLNSL
jgi:hypothetical protein